MASSSYSNPYIAPQPGSLSVEPYRGPGGFLPLVDCSKCGTKLIGRVSQKPGSKGKRFYKCPLLEHTDFACGTYMFEEQYVEYLVAGGHIPRGCSQIRGRDRMAMEVVQDGGDRVKSDDMVMFCDMVKSLLDSHTTLNNKLDKIAERALAVGVAMLFVLVLILLVLLVK